MHLNLNIKEDIILKAIEKSVKLITEDKPQSHIQSQVEKEVDNRLKNLLSK